MADSITATRLGIEERYWLFDESLDGTQYLTPHPNVAFQPSVHRPGKAQGDTVLSELQRFNPSNYDLHSMIKSVFLQLLHAVNHIHRCWNVSHGSIALEHLYISEQNRRLVLTLPDKWKKVNKTDDSIEKDIADLGNLFRWLIRQAGVRSTMTDISLHNDLLGVMGRDREINILLKHPYFWDTQKMANFLLDVAQFSKGHEGNPLKQWLDNDDVLARVCLGGDWKEKLLLKSQEIDITENNLRRCRPAGRGQRVNTDILKELASTTSAAGAQNYKGNRIQSLLNFFRNRVEHFHEDSRKVQACFNFDKTIGVFDFFNRRYPQLFITVYQVFSQYRKERNDLGIGNLYFTPAQNMDFPTTR